MDAGDFDRILAQWEETGEISPHEVEAIEDALSHGDPNARRVRRLLPLLRRDAQEAAAQTMTTEDATARATPSQPDTERTHTDTPASIMQAIASEERATEDSSPSRPASSGEQSPARQPAPASAPTSAPEPTSTSRFPRLGATFHRQGVRAAAVAASLVFAVAAASLVSYSLGYQQGSGSAETAVTETAEQSDTVTVHFRVVMPEAEEVSLIGDFNDWDPEATPLTLREDGRTWSATLDLRNDRAYTYNFVVDDEQVIPDPAADRTIPDSFGGEKSVISL